MYDNMPFDLMNTGETFQRAMDITFVGKKEKFVDIYLDDITVFFKLMRLILNRHSLNVENLDCHGILENLIFPCKREGF